MINKVVVEGYVVGTRARETTLSKNNKHYYKFTLGIPTGFGQSSKMMFVNVTLFEKTAEYFAREIQGVSKQKVVVSGVLSLVESKSESGKYKQSGIAINGDSVVLCKSGNIIYSAREVANEVDFSEVSDTKDDGLADIFN